MALTYPGIDQMKQFRNSLIDTVSQRFSNSMLPNPPGMQVTDPGTYQGASNALMQMAVPQPEDTMMGLLKPTFKPDLSAAFKLKNGKIVDTGPMHILPDNINSDDIVELGFVRKDTGNYLSREEASKLIPDYVNWVEEGRLHSSDIGKIKPYRMTKSDWMNLYQNNTSASDHINIHKRSIKDALDRGYEIPEDVLKSYKE